MPCIGTLQFQPGRIFAGLVCAGTGHLLVGVSLAWLTWDGCVMLFELVLDFAAMSCALCTCLLRQFVVSALPFWLGWDSRPTSSVLCRLRALMDCSPCVQVGRYHCSGTGHLLVGICTSWPAYFVRALVHALLGMFVPCCLHVCSSHV